MKKQKEFSYYEAIEQSTKELIDRLNDDNMVVFGEILDNPIYPLNEELYKEFCDNEGYFEESEFISYLIRINDNLTTEFNYNIDELMIVKREEK